MIFTPAPLFTSPPFLLTSSPLKKYPTVQFVQPVYTWCVQEHGQPTGDHTAKERWLSFPQKPLNFSSSLAGGRGLWAPPLFVLAVDWLDLVQTTTAPGNSGVPWSCQVKKTLFFSGPPKLLALTVFPCPFPEGLTTGLLVSWVSQCYRGMST